MINRYVVASLLMLFIVTSASIAGITGILVGKVTEKDGKAVGGVTVKVMGTPRGGFTKGDGTYRIINIAAGTYDVRATAVGYDTVTRRISISADQTAELDFVLTQGGITTKTVDVSAEREMVRSTDIGTNRILKGDNITKVGRDNLVNVLALNPGTRLEGRNFVVRGSRPEETQILVDGLTVSDQFTGGTGANVSAAGSASIPSPFATEEVQTQTGGFGAEYGNAVGGVINTVIKTGRTDRFEGLLRWRKDVPFLWGQAGNGIDAGYPLQDLVDVSFGGPLGINRSSFFFNMRNTYENYRNYGLQVYDPVGYNLGMRPNERSWVRNMVGRIKLGLTDDVSLLLGGLYGTSFYERSNTGWLYANQEGYKTDNFGNPILDANGNIQYNGMKVRVAQQAIIQEFASNAFAQVNHTLGENTVYELRASFNSKVSEIGKRKTNDAPGIFTGWDIYYPEDNIKTQNGEYVSGVADRIIDAYNYLPGQNDLTKDGLTYVPITKPNPITGYVEGPADYQSTNNPYGLISYFAYNGNEFGVDLRRATYWQVDGNLTHLFETGATKHVIKTGFELRFTRLTRHYNSNPWDGNSFYDIYGNDYGGNIYYDPKPGENTAAVLQRTESPYTPINGAFFVQDQIIFNKLVFTPGLRVDYLDVGSVYRTNPGVFSPISEPEKFSETNKQVYFSPRVTILYPMSDDGRQNFNLSYGVYYQISPWSNYFDNFNVLLPRGQILGDPNLKLQRTNTYQVAYNHQLSDYFTLTITGYYKDIYNQPDVAYVRAVPQPYYQQTVAAYGSAKGVEFTFQRLLVDNWGFMLNYTLASSFGTANNNSTIVTADPYTGLPAYPVEPFPLSTDRRHRINLVFDLSWSEDEGPTIGGIPFLENFSVNLAGFWQTGLPYTPINRGGQAIAGINSARYPSSWNTDLRIIRTIPLGGFLGEKTAMDLFIDITNLLNFTNPISFYTRTGNPDYDGLALNRLPGDFPSITYFRNGDVRNKASYNVDQYDRYGNRKYNQLVDYNSDGVVTSDESYRGYQTYVQNVVNQRGNYQYPRQVYFGVALRF